MPRSIGINLFLLVGLLSTLPVIAWLHLEEGDREAREQIVLSLRDRSPYPRVFGNTAATDVASTEFKTAKATGPTESNAGGPCKPSGTGVSSCTAALHVAPGLSATASSVVASFDAPTAALLTIANRWNSPRLYVAAAAYAAVLVAAFVILFGVMRRLNAFRDAVEEVVLGRLGNNALSSRNAPPELADVARLLDRLMADLGYTIKQMSTAANDHAHSLRTPLATIKTAMHGVKRYMPENDARARRVVSAIDVSIDRISLLVDAAQSNGQSVASLVAAPRQRIDLAGVVEAALAHTAGHATQRGVRVLKDLEEPITVEANAEILESAVRNVLMSAIESSPSESEVRVTLSNDGATATLMVEDCHCECTDVGSLLEQTFDSLPPDGASESCWPRLSDVRRAVESLGGRASARRNDRGGKSVSLAWPVTTSHLPRVIE